MWVWVALGLLGGWVLPAHAAPLPVLINELYYDHPSEDTGNEWVELRNVGSAAVDLSGWTVERGGTTFSAVFTFPDGARIDADQYLLVGEDAVQGAQFTGALAFQNGGSATDGVRLLNKEGTVVDVVLYDAPNTNGLPGIDGAPGQTFAPDVSAGRSLARVPDGSGAPGDSGAFAETANLTPGRVNPESADTAPPPSAPSSQGTGRGGADHVVVNEVLPDAVGKDEYGEFVELFNPGTATANLSGYEVDDAEGGSRPYTIPDGTTVPAGGFLVLNRQDTKLAFNNTADRARLLRPDGSLLLELTYDDVPGEGAALARTAGGSATWTGTPTPGAANVFTATSAELGKKVAGTSAPARATSTPAATGRVAGARQAAAGTTARVGTSLTAQSPPRGGTGRATPGTTSDGSEEEADKSAESEEVSLADLRSRDVGTRVRTRGVVAALPGTWDAQLLYLAGSGIGVVLAEGSWPAVALGDTLDVVGSIAEPRRERFIAVASPDDLAKGNAGPPPAPHEVSLADVGEAWEGSLMRVRGRVSERHEDALVLSEGDARVRVATRAARGWEFPTVDDDTVLTVSGILSESDDGYRLLPRSQDDVVVEESAVRRPLWARPLAVLAGLCLIVAGALALIRTRRLRARAT